MNFDIVESEILVCAGLCVNDFNYEGKEVLLVNIKNVNLLKMLARLNARVHCVGVNRADFGDLDTDCANSVIFYDLAINLKVHKFDLIIDLENKSVENYQKLLKDNGILIVDLERLESSVIAKKNADFNVLMPFRLQFEGCEKCYIFASRRFHPIADFSLQKLDMMDALRYCNAKVYEGAFAMPNYIKDELRAVVRN